MTKMDDFPIVGSYNNQRIINIDAERTVNMFQFMDALGKKTKQLINTSGLDDSGLIFTSATGGFREQFVFNNIMYVVIGANAYSITSSGTVALLGALLNTTSGYVGIDANTFQVIFVDGVNGYIWDTNALTFTKITDTSFPVHPIDVCYLDGFFVVINGQTNNFQLSMFNQGMVWGPATNTFTASTVGSLITVSSTANYQTGVPITFSNSGGALPVPLNSSDTYYVIYVSATTIKVATSYANAIAGTNIVLTTNGTGTNTITSLGQLQLGSITSHPGTLVACRTLHRRIFFFSQFFTEVWENAGIGTNLPFRRNNSLLIEYGATSAGSVAVGFDILIFQSNDRDGLGSVMQVSGTQAIPISTLALDNQLSKYAAAKTINDCRAFLIKEYGLIFYRMNFTAANHTYVYNVTLSNPSSDASKLWHEEEILDGDRHPAQTGAFFNGLNYVGDYQNPILYILDPNTYTNNGEPIRRMRITPNITPPGYQRIRVDRLQIDLQQGQLNAQQLQVPSIALFVFLSISKDGGQTYGNSIKAHMGVIGQRTFRTVWRKLGTIPRGQGWIIKVEFFQQVPFVILGAAWSVELLPE